MAGNGAVKTIHDAAEQNQAKGDVIKPEGKCGGGQETKDKTKAGHHVGRDAAS